uniref:Fc receptor-like protein 5 isoform X3 n=1 Tax=Pristiophorus japonicus TaxID=55135 RepID=UPI00398ECB8C
MLQTIFSLWIVLFHVIKTMESWQVATISNVQIISDSADAENVQEGNTITLTCSANIVIPLGLPSQILYIFYKGSNKGFLLKNVTSTKQESQYTIQPARASHSGYYYCVVVAGSTREKSETTYITVTGKLQRPVLSIHPMVVTVGNSTELRCEISGEIPPLTFIFYKYSGRYLRLADTKDTNKSFATHTLKVAENTVKDYCCKVHGNSKDSISNYSEIVKLSVQALEVSKPILQSDSNTNTLKKGQALTLKCTVSKGSFPITYMFFHGSLNHSTTSSYNEEKYLIRSVNNHHSGRYYCTASNAATSEAKQSNHIVMEVFGCSQAAVPVAWILVTTLLLSISIICSN